MVQISLVPSSREFPFFKTHPINSIQSISKASRSIQSKHVFCLPFIFCRSVTLPYEILFPGFHYQVPLSYVTIKSNCLVQLYLSCATTMQFHYHSVQTVCCYSFPLKLKLCPLKKNNCNKGLSTKECPSFHIHMLLKVPLKISCKCFLHCILRCSQVLSNTSHGCRTAKRDAWQSM